MKTTALLSALTLAVVAIAAPAEIEARGGGGGSGGSGGTCNSDNHQQVCCNGGGLLGLACTVGILSTGCNQGTYCCETNSAFVSSLSLQSSVFQVVTQKIRAVSSTSMPSTASNFRRIMNPRLGAYGFGGGVASSLGIGKLA